MCVLEVKGPQPPEGLLEQGFFHFKVNLIGDGGLFGSIDFLLRRKTNGEDVVQEPRRRAASARRLPRAPTSQAPSVCRNAETTLA